MRRRLAVGVFLSLLVVMLPKASANHDGSLCRLYWDDTYESYTDQPSVHNEADCQSAATASSAFDWAWTSPPPPTTTTTSTSTTSTSSTTSSTTSTTSSTTSTTSTTVAPETTTTTIETELVVLQGIRDRVELAGGLALFVCFAFLALKAGRAGVS
jgi:hypothetical protein